MQQDTKFGCAFLAVWALMLSASLAFTGVVIWAIIQLVNHFT